MNGLKELNEARRAEVNLLVSQRLYWAEQELRTAIKLFCDDHSRENMELLNGAWSKAAAVFKMRTETSPDGPAGGAVEWRKAA